MGKFTGRFQIGSALKKNTRTRAHAGTDHNGCRCRESQGARASDDKHRHGTQQRGFQRGVEKSVVNDARQRRNRNHRGHEPSGNDIRQSLNGRFGFLRRRHDANDLRKHRIGADRLRRHRKGRRAVHRAAGHRIADRFFYRHTFTGQHRFVHFRCAFADLTVHRNLLTRFDPKRHADRHVMRVNGCDFFPVFAMGPRGRRGKQCFQRSSGAAFRGRFQVFTE